LYFVSLIPHFIIYWIEEVETLIRVEKESFGLAPEKERALGIYLEDPEGSLKKLVDTLRRYHDLAIAPYWPRIREHLEGDTIKRRHWPSAASRRSSRD
jgi:hypothetical protein